MIRPYWSIVRGAVGELKKRLRNEGSRDNLYRNKIFLYGEIREATKTNKVSLGSAFFKNYPASTAPAPPNIHEQGLLMSPRGGGDCSDKRGAIECRRFSFVYFVPCNRNTLR